MSFTAFVDVAIGLIVVYLGASLMVTVANEWISRLRGWRRIVLGKSLERLFNGRKLVDSAEKLPEIGILSALLESQGERADPQLLARGLAAALNGGDKATLDAVRQHIRHLPSSPASHALTAIASTCADDLERFIGQAGAWIDHALGELGEAYRQRMQIASFGLGLVIAVGFNIDTLYLTQRLYEDKALRDRTVATAGAIAAVSDAKALETCAREWSADRSKVSEACKPVARLLETTTAGNDELPIGWSKSRRGLLLAEIDLLALATLGWLLTAVAVSFGAPFWFDLLGKLLSLRRSVAKPAAP